ncbi:MAG: hypothetical protein ACRENZ_02850 [Thermodesulfobacteriota bacterium]
MFWVLQLKHDYFVWLADAFLHGRVDIQGANEYLGELIPVGGKLYVIYPPMPAVALLPFVAIWGTNFSQALASFIFGGLNVSLFFLFMKNLTENVKIQIWMTLLFSFGTIHWYLASWGSAWYFAHVISFLFLTLAIYETFTKQRPFYVGILLGASYLSRLPTILSLPFFIIMLSHKWILDSKELPFLNRLNIKPLIQLCFGLGIFIIFNFAYNYVRFSNPFDVAYSMLGKSQEPWYEALFSLSYIPQHLSVLIFKTPSFVSDPPYLVPSLTGMSIFLTTPAFLYAFFAGIRNRIAIACWLAIFPVAFLIFIKGGTGFTMFGYRYAMDFYPFLLILTAMGIGDRIRWHHKLLISLSILVNLWGVICINKFAKFVWW